MAGKNYGTMNQGFYYDEAKKIGYDISVDNLWFSNVAYHSKKWLIDQLVHSGYSKDDIKIERVTKD